MAEAAWIIEVEELVKRYGDFTAVDGISFRVAEGGFFGFLGPNGAARHMLRKSLRCAIHRVTRPESQE